MPNIVARKKRIQTNRARRFAPLCGLCGGPVSAREARQIKELRRKINAALDPLIRRSMRKINRVLEEARRRRQELRSRIKKIGK
mgnify:CR=1 FL=1